jgi:hypothetical protein
MSGSATVVASLTLLAVGSSWAMHPAACPDGVYLVQGPPLLPAPSHAYVDAVVLDHGSVAVRSGCPAVPGRFRLLANGTLIVRARWRECRGVRRVQMRAVVPPGCASMQGRLVGRRLQRHFEAVRCVDPAGCPPAVCGGIRGLPCGAGEYCDLPAGSCDTADLEGMCVDVPETCTTERDPVCGCDGITYGNDCERQRAQAQKAHRGACEPQRCDVTHPCSSGQFCEMPAGICASGLDTGVCVAVPGACPEVYHPVCGCDGITYANDCERRRAMVQPSRDGTCEATCDVTRPCPRAQFCELPPGICASALDAGQCVDVPAACLQVYQPVCGCDGVTYGNDCERQAAKAQKSRDGRCDAWCETACDCYHANLGFPEPCAALCPTCDNYWACENATCVAHCGPVPTPESCGSAPG